MATNKCNNDGYCSDDIYSCRCAFDSAKERADRGFADQVASAVEALLTYRESELRADEHLAAWLKQQGMEVSGEVVDQGKQLET